MHAQTGLASDLYYGFGDRVLYLRVDFVSGSPPGVEHGLRIDGIEPQPVRFEILSLAPGAPPVRCVSEVGNAEVEGAACRIDRIVEIAIPLAALGVGPRQSFEAMLQILENGQPVESLPPGDVLRAVVPDESLDPTSWAP